MSEIGAERPSTWRSFWRGLGMFILWLIRLVFAIGLGTLLGVAIYYVAYEGIPAFYSQVLVPIQVHDVEIDILQRGLQDAQSNLGTDLRASREEIRTLQKLVDEQAVIIQSLRSSLEAEKANREQHLSLLQSNINRTDELAQRQGTALGKLESSASKLSVDLAAASDKIEKLGGDLASVQKQAQANEGTANKLSDSLKALQTDVLKISDNLADVQKEVIGLRGVITMPITLSDAFERRLVLMQAAEGILKARLHLLEKNSGYAKQALALARDNVARFVALSADLKAEELAPLVKRAEAASALIESDPFVAAQELEIIWYSLEKLISTPVAPAATPAAAQATPTVTAAPAERAPTTPTTVPVSPTPTPTPRR